MHYRFVYPYIISGCIFLISLCIGGNVTIDSGTQETLDYTMKFLGIPGEECHPALELNSRQETRKLPDYLCPGSFRRGTPGLGPGSLTGMAILAGRSIQRGRVVCPRKAKT